MPSVLFVFVGGQSGVGKSTFSQVVKDHFKAQGKTCLVISTDNYFCEKPPEIDLKAYQQTTNFDLPERQDFELLFQHIITLNNRQAIYQPIFDFTISRRKPEFIKLISSDVVIIEGIFILDFVNKWIVGSDINISYLPVLVSNESWKTTVEQRIERNKEFGLDEEWLRQQEQKNVGPGCFKYTLVQTPGLIYFENSSIHFSVLKELKKSPKEFFDIVKRCEKNPDFKVPRLHEVRREKSYSSSLDFVKENLRKQIEEQLTDKTLANPQQSHLVKVNTRKAQEIIAESYSQYNGTKIGFFPNRLFQSYGPYEKLTATESQLKI